MATTGKASYLGLFRHTFDDKNRVTIPSAWRTTHVDGDAFLATPHPGGYISILPQAEIDKLHAKISEIPLSDGPGQDFAASFFATAQNVWFDSQGRITLTPELMRHAGITKDAVLAGSLNKFGVYSPERWDGVQQRSGGGNTGENMRRLGI